MTTIEIYKEKEKTFAYNPIMFGIFIDNEYSDLGIIGRDILKRAVDNYFDNLAQFQEKVNLKIINRNIVNMDNLFISVDDNPKEIKSNFLVKPDIISKSFGRNYPKLANIVIKKYHNRLYKFSSDTLNDSMKLYKKQRLLNNITSTSFIVDEPDVPQLGP